MKIISAITSIIMMIPSLFGLYGTDAKDTEAAYRETVAAMPELGFTGWLPENAPADATV